MKGTPKHIPGIYNYCDRWCEKCDFTDRCMNYERMEDPLPSDPNDFVERIQKNFTEALQWIEKAAVEQGMDWEKLKEEAKDFVKEEPTLTNNQEKLNQLSTHYYKNADTWLKSKQALLRKKEKELLQKNKLGIDVQQEVQGLNNALEFIQYYLFFIHAKIKRSLEGLHDKWMLEEFPIQNDANGSAKVALIATERSLSAWEIVRQGFPESEDELLDILSLLSQILKGIKQEFPKVEQFIRPGFDEENSTSLDTDLIFKTP